MLTNEETLNLVELSKNGDNVAKEQLITINSPLIKSIVKRYLNKGVDYDDLYQLGALGFIKAINNYDSAFNVKFTTYAVPMIAGEIKRFLRDDGSVKVSRTIKHNAIIIKNYIQELSKNGIEQPTVEQIAKHLNLELNDVILAMEANSAPLSLNDSFTDDDNNTIMDKIADSFSQESLIDKLSLRDAIEKLTAKEKQVVILRYYLDKTQNEIAKELGVSQVQVSRIENKILNEIKNEMTAN